MNCPQCAAENPEGAKFCLNCGTALAVACPRCGALLPPQARFCIECGAPVGAPSRESPPAEPDALTARLQRLVPKEYAERLLASQSQLGPERRTVTILFSDVKGSTALAEHLDPEDVLDIMDGAFDVLIEPVYRYEGMLARLMGDAVLAFFGAPIAHEDDPERAIRAALDIIEGAREYAARLEQERGISDFTVRVGIHTGLVVVGEVGSDLRVEYTAMGDAINLASRMEQHAPPGGILISYDTYRHVRGVFDVLAQEPLLVKGRTEPVATYRVQRAKPRAFRKPVRGVEGIETRMVGREAELKRLQEAFHAVVEDGELQVTTISGEAGVGKSRLLHEFDTWAELLPLRFYYFKGRALPEMQNQPYGLIRDLIAFRFQIRESDPARTVREKLEGGVALVLGSGEGSRQSAHLIGRLVGFELGDSPHLAGLPDDPQQVRDRALASLVAYFQAMADRSPVLILLEDLHWADDSSLDLLNHLAPALRDRPVMIAGGARPALFERRPHWGEGQPFHHRLALEPLSRWDSRRLVAEILHRLDQVPDALRDLIVTGAEGNPFFIEELIKMLVEDGVIVKGEHQWHVAPGRLAGARVPPTLTGILQARVDRLPLEERTVLQQASVVGRLFWDRAVARINESAEDGIERAAIQDNLAALRGREMVFQRETSAFTGAQEYLFKHALLREVAYESLLKRLRRVYHGLVADWLLEQRGERVEEYTALIADHLALAGRAEEAVEYLLQAGDRARALYAHQEASRAYERALALLEEQAADPDAASRAQERAARTQMKLGLTYDSAFDFQRARQAYEAGFALWQQSSQKAATGPLPPAPHALRVAGTSDPQTLDPGFCHDADGARVIWQLFSGLVGHTSELGIVPDVAASWEMLDGGRRYVFHLRDDVVWSDGMPVTAHDFEVAWKRVLDPATGSRNASLLYNIQGARAYHEGLVPEPHALGVRALDGVTLMVELEGPSGYFLHLLAQNATFPVPRQVVDRHRAAWAEAGNIVTNGPFLLESWRPGEVLVFKRNPQYHRQSRGNVTRVELTLLPTHERTVALEMYDGGRLDILELPAGIEDVDLIRQRRAGEYVTTPIAATKWLSFDVRRAPFVDPRVRRAFAQAVDRELMAEVTYEGYKSPATGGFVPPGTPGHSPGIALPYDPERARQLLAEAGYPGGRGFPSLDAVTPRGPGWRRVNDYLREQWRENLGVDIPWQEVEFAEFLQRFFGRQGHLFRNTWVADYPDPDNFLRVFVLSRTAWRHGPYLELVERAQRSLDQAERMQLYARAERILADEAPILPLFYERNHMLVKPWIRGFPSSAMEEVFWKDVVIEPH